MKKIVLTLLLFFFTENAFALSGGRENIEYQSCYSASVQDGESPSFAKAYCKCFANKLDKKYTDKQLDKLVAKGYDYMMKEITPYAKSCLNKLGSQSSNQGSNMINLTCYMNDPGSPILSPHIIQIFPNKKYFKLPEYGMNVPTLRISKDWYNGTYEMGVNVKWYINRNTGGITYVLSGDGQEVYHEGICKKTTAGQKF